MTKATGTRLDQKENHSGESSPYCLSTELCVNQAVIALSHYVHGVCYTEKH